MSRTERRAMVVRDHLYGGHPRSITLADSLQNRQAVLGGGLPRYPRNPTRLPMPPQRRRVLRQFSPCPWSAAYPVLS